MCGISACCIDSPAPDFLLTTLQRLEYRGYDSAGLSIRLTDGGTTRLRTVGRVAALETRVADKGPAGFCGLGIGHTRWATHGAATESNAHPHIDCAGDVHVVHNGVIENAGELRSELELRGHRFATSVDTEVVAHLIESELRDDADPLAAVQKATARLAGSWALAVLCARQDVLVVSAYRSPLVVAMTRRGAVVASDAAVLAPWTDEVHALADGDCAELGRHAIRWSRADGSASAPPRWTLRHRADDLALGGAPDHMAKEIGEQSEAISAIVERLAPGIADARLWRSLDLPALRRVRFVACGTSMHAAAVLHRVLAMAGVASTYGPASESDCWVQEPDTVTVALSQSGETADVLQALEHHASGPVLAITNTPHSTLARGADALVRLDVGTEVGVAATKTFTAQVVVGAAVLLSGLVAAAKLDPRRAAEQVGQLALLPGQMADAHRYALAALPTVVDKLTDADGFLFVARGAAVPYAAEGALKLKEITYRWAEAFAAGELKHGPIALIDQGTPVVAIDDGHRKLDTNLAEIRARGAHVITVGGPMATVPYRKEAAADAPWGPLAAAVTLQHLARELAVRLGRDVDRPRNLAKSVTVE